MFNKLLSVFAIATFLWSTSAVTGDYEVYTCPDNWSGRNCSGCKKVATGTYSFKVNTDKQLVIMQIFGKKDDSTYSLSLDNCKVIDAKNWVCSTDGIGYNNTLSPSSQESMTDDMFKQTTNMFHNVGCGKRKGWFD